MFFREDGMDEVEAERFALASMRIREVPEECVERLKAAPVFAEYFRRTAQFLVMALEERDFLARGGQDAAEEGELAARNRALYEDVLPEHYGESFVNPEYAAEKLGGEYGPVLCAVAYEMRSVVSLLYQGAAAHALIRYELFLEMYGAFTAAAPALPAEKDLRGRLRDYLSDYAEYESEYEQRMSLLDDDSLACRIVREADLSNSRYLYAYGEYVTADETGAASFLRDLPEERLALCADTFTEGYRTGFAVTGKDLSKKRFCSVYYHLGFERMMRRAFENFGRMGLRTATPFEVPTLFRRHRSDRVGWAGADANPQLRFDHREDDALVLDRALAGRRIEALAAAYEHLPDAKYYAGPAVLEVFGGAPFTPADVPGRISYDETQTGISASFNTKAYMLYAKAVVAEERSFTIIDFPLPSIADTPARYADVFDAVIRINTLDYHQYQEMQARLIDALNEADHVEVKGCRGNRTDLVVKLFPLTDPEHQAIFENCVADVNIPVGEVFTTPVLEGTHGLLQVSSVYLEGLRFEDLWLRFEDGRVTDYGCANFTDPAQGRRYIEENILFHHTGLPMGECAIGTNTTAFVLARKYGMEAKLPILIAEKTGPHFAVGDTCYSNEEDNRTFNPDGKEIVAKENSVSCRRKEDPEGAYFGCHTDITIPYDELGEYTAVRADGSRIPIIRDGRFVLPGTEALNKPFAEE